MQQHTEDFLASVPLTFTSNLTTYIKLPAYFALMKLVFNGLNNKNMTENLQLKLSKEKRSLRKNAGASE